MALKIAKKALMEIGFYRFQPARPNLKKLGIKHQTLCTDGQPIVTMIRGEGCGPELTSYVEEVFQTAKVPVSFDVQETQAKTPEHRQKNLQNIMASIDRTGIALAGYLDRHASQSIAQSSQLNITLNRNHSYQPEINKKPTIDNIIIRSTGNYSNVEHARWINFRKDIPMATMDRFRKNTETLTHFAFELVRRENRTKVTTVHETNGELSSDVISLGIVEEIACKYYPFIKYENVDLKRWLRQLAEDPGQFDVLLLHNFHPGVKYDLANWIEDTTVLTDTQKVGSNVVFEGMDRKFCRNPIPMLNAAVHMLEHMGLGCEAQVIKHAINATVFREDIRTRDLGGSATSRAVVDSINHFIELAKSTTSFGIL